MSTRYFIPFHSLILKSYSLHVTYEKSKTLLTMHSFDNMTTTDDLPATIPLLKKHLPNIFTSECFNDLSLSFEDEARQTEIGHLFEHILLENLCHIKLAYGFGQVEFSGVTRWNWHKNPRGMFDIEISAKREDRIIFNEALKKSIKLMNLIFEESTLERSYVTNSYHAVNYNFTKI